MFTTRIAISRSFTVAIAKGSIVLNAACNVRRNVGDGDPPEKVIPDKNALLVGMEHIAIASITQDGRRRQRRTSHVGGDWIDNCGWSGWRGCGFAFAD